MRLVREEAIHQLAQAVFTSCGRTLTKAIQLHLSIKIQMSLTAPSPTQGASYHYTHTKLVWQTTYSAAIYSR